GWFRLVGPGSDLRHPVSWASVEFGLLNVQPQNWSVHKLFSPREVQSSLLEAPVTGSIPVEEVASNMFAGKKPNASSSYGSMSHTQSAPSVLNSISSLLQLQGSSSPNAQNVFNQSTSGPGSYSQSSQYGSGLQRVSAQLSSTPGSSGSQLAGGSSQLVSASGLFTQSPSTEISPGQFASKQEGSGRYNGLSMQSQSTSSQHSPGSSAYAKLAASPLGVSRLTSGPSSYSQYTSSSQSRAGTQLAGSSHHAPVQSSTFTDGSFLQLQGTPSQYAPSPLDVKVPVYSKAPSGPSLSLSQPSQWQPSSKWSQGFQTSGAVASQSNSPSQGSKAPSKFSTLTSAASPSQFASKQEGSGRYSGLSSRSQSASTLYSPGSPAYIKRGFSLLDDSRQSASGPSTYSKYTSSSQSRSGTQLAGSSPYVPVQSVSTSTDGSSLQLLGTSSQNARSPLDVKVPVYSKALSGPSLSRSQPSPWQTSSRWSQGFQTSGTVASQSSSRSKAPSSFSTLTSAAGPGHFASKQEGSGKYSGFSSLSQGTSSQYSPGSSLDVSSQSTSDPNSSGLYASSSPSMAVTQLAGSSPMPVQTGSTFTEGSSFQFQGTSNQYPPSVSSQYTQASSGGSSFTGSEASQKWQPSASTWSQEFQASGTGVHQSRSSPQSSQTSSGSTFLPALSPSVAQGSQSSISSPLRISSFFGVGQRPSKLSAPAASGSQIHSQISPGLSASVQHPSDSMTSSLGSSVQGALQGIFSGQSSSTYGQKPSGYSKPSQSSSATGRYFSSVKG
uniref:Zgc:111868 n=1 Tax=Sinocyclocheilus rhinocerous TaxID=307959 RepID=A0A673LIN9_9TELE